MKPNRNNPYHRPAFTLVELLVVIAIIAVLVAISITGVFRFRKAADKTGAINSARALQLANASYAADHNGIYLPVYAFNDKGQGPSTWFTNTDYLPILTGDPTIVQNGSVVKPVPVSVLDPKVVREKKNLWNDLSANFGYNNVNAPGGGWGGKGTTRAFRQSQLSDPARTAAFVSATDWNLKYSGRFLWSGTGGVEGKTGDGKMAFRHDGKAVVVYYDGHTGLLSMNDIEGIDNKGGDKNIFWDAAAP